MAQFDYSKVKDPTFFKENVLAAHSSHIAYGNKGELFDGKSSLRASLDGIWKFSYAVNYASSVKGFEKQSMIVLHGMISEYRHISRWKGMTAHSILIRSTHGTAEKM